MHNLQIEPLGPLPAGFHESYLIDCTGCLIDCTDCYWREAATSYGEPAYCGVFHRVSAGCLDSSDTYLDRCQEDSTVCDSVPTYRNEAGAVLFRSGGSTRGDRRRTWHVAPSHDRYNRSTLSTCGWYPGHDYLTSVSILWDPRGIQDDTPTAQGFSTGVNPLCAGDHQAHLGEGWIQTFHYKDGNPPHNVLFRPFCGSCDISVVGLDLQGNPVPPPPPPPPRLPCCSTWGSCCHPCHGRADFIRRCEAGLDQECTYTYCRGRNCGDHCSCGGGGLDWCNAHYGPNQYNPGWATGVCDLTC